MGKPMSSRRGNTRNKRELSQKENESVKDLSMRGKIRWHRGYVSRVYRRRIPPLLRNFLARQGRDFALCGAQYIKNTMKGIDMKTNEQITDAKLKENNLPTLNWRRISKAVRQYAWPDMVDECPAVLKDLTCIAELCGSHSVGRKKLLALSKSLLNPERKVVCPICLDTHDLVSPGNVPLLVKKHEQFLCALFERIGSLPVVMSVPTHEAVATSGRATEIVATVNEYVRHRGWCAHAMHELFPDIAERETFWVRELQNADSTQRRLRDFARKRRESGVYLHRSPGVSADETVTLTLRTSAQYLALGESIKTSNWIVCNHTTLNLAWYSRVGAALLHNPVYLY